MNWKYSKRIYILIAGRLQLRNQMRKSILTCTMRYQEIPNNIEIWGKNNIALDEIWVFLVSLKISRRRLWLEILARE